MFLHKSLMEYYGPRPKKKPMNFILDGSPGLQHDTNLIKSLLLKKEELGFGELHSP